MSGCPNVLYLHRNFPKMLFFYTFPLFIYSNKFFQAIKFRTIAAILLLFTFRSFHRDIAAEYVLMTSVANAYSLSKAHLTSIFVVFLNDRIPLLMV